MSTSFIGFSHGRNAGHRGRVNNMDPRFAMNPKQFVRKVENHQETNYNYLQSQKVANRVYGYKPPPPCNYPVDPKEKEQMDVVPSTRTQTIESNRLKRKSEAFNNEYEDFFIRKKRKTELKLIAKETAKKERENQKLLALIEANQKSRDEKIEKEKEKERKQIEKQQQKIKHPKLPRPPQPSKKQTQTQTQTQTMDQAMDVEPENKNN